MLKEVARSINGECKVTQKAQAAASFERAGQQAKPQALWTTASAPSSTSFRLLVHDYLVEIEAVDEGPPDFTRCVRDELLFQHFLEGETMKL